MEPAIKIKHEPGLKPKRASLTVPAAVSAAPIPATATVKTERLSSFRVPRDLTLGGLANGRTVKPATNKKVYTPNLNAVRNKDTNVKTASTGPKQRVKTERKDKDSKTGGKGKGSLIQTTGIFSEGLAQRALQQRSKYDKYNSSSKEPGETIRRPVYRTEIKVDPEEERKRISDLVGDPDESEILVGNAKKLDDLTMPVKLENLDYKFKAMKPEVKDEIPKPGELLESIQHNGNPNNFFMLQLPDALPGKMDTEVRKTDTSGGEEIPKIEPPRCTVRELEEGYVGKLLRYRSGKVKLLLGNTLFDLTMGMDSGFLQELVSISTNLEERNGNIVNLAAIKAKLNASPNWENLFE